MLKEIVALMLGRKDFGDKSGVYLRCCCGPKTKRIGEADGPERWLAEGAQRTEMGCYSCKKMGVGCWGPFKEIRTA